MDSDTGVFAGVWPSDYSSVLARRGAVGWLGWEIAKLALSVALLVLAPRLVGPGLSWLALVAGLVVAMKLVWVALWSWSRTKAAAVPPDSR